MSDDASFSGEHPDADTHNAREDWLYHCIGKGWHPILAQAIEQVKELSCLTIVDVKEKWGELRIFVEHDWLCESSDAEIGEHFDEAIRIENEASSASCKVCEHCGKAGETQPGSWLKTLCDECASQ